MVYIIVNYAYSVHVWLPKAFESKANIQMPSDREISNSWVVVSWDPLTSVVDRNGNSLGAVIGFYITYQVCVLAMYGCFICTCMYSL